MLQMFWQCKLKIYMLFVKCVRKVNKISERELNCFSPFSLESKKSLKKNSGEVI